MTTTTKGQVSITCDRCGGTGHYSFCLAKGTVCFKCWGEGKITVDAEKHRRAKERAKERAEEQKAVMLENATLANAKLDALHARYQDDPRIGTAERERMERFEAVRQEVYRTLEAIDSGANTHKETLERLGRNAEIPLNVPYKERAVAKNAGAKWCRNRLQWVWPEGTMALPNSLSKYLS